VPQSVIAYIPLPNSTQPLPFIIQRTNGSHMAIFSHESTTLK
jgi:hypothetical protein